MNEKLNIGDVSPGGNFYKWWDSGAMGVSQMVVTVVRVNRATVTVKSEHRDKPVRIGMEYFLNNYRAVDWGEA